MYKKRLLIFIIVAGLIAGTRLFVMDKDKTNNMAGMDMSSQTSVQSHPTYSLNLMSGTKYQPNSATPLHFAIQDQTGKILKSYDTVHEKKLHLIVVRKDRTNFQHIHPILDQSSGMWMLQPFTFPTDGEYRVFADFTPSNAQKDATGMKLSATPYKDVTVGDLSKYTPESLGSDRYTSNVSGLSTSLVLLSDDSAGAVYTAGVPLLLGVRVNKDGVPFKNLQTYLGALGHMVVLGPNLEYIHAHAMDEDIATQSGLIAFQVTFPDPGQYKIYLQTQTDNQVNTTDYTVTVNGNPSSNSSNTESMPGMNNMNH